MYEQYYGLAEKPFGLTPDTEFYFRSFTHEEALNALVLAIKLGDGFVKFTGEVGTGKTLLCRKLLDLLEPDFDTAYIPNPYLTCDALLQAVVNELGISKRQKKKPPLDCINHHLISSARKGRSTVIIMDEAQSIPVQSLEAIRLLSNLETEKKKLVQIVLFGQPELDQLLSNSSIRQLKQRIAHTHELQPLAQDSIRTYLHHRTKSAGYRGPELFDLRAQKRIFKWSHGVPRLINVLCNKAMMLSYASGDFYIQSKHIDAAASDMQVQ